MKDRCIWERQRDINGDKYYLTSCDKTPSNYIDKYVDDEYTYCPFCGKKITIDEFVKRLEA